MSQNRELDIARFIVEKTDSNIFLTGKAGTGKTTFLKDVKKYTKKNHIVLAPTGVAAVNAGAMTIHSFFQFCPAVWTALLFFWNQYCSTMHTFLRLIRYLFAAVRACCHSHNLFPPYFSFSIPSLPFPVYFFPSLYA